MGGEPELLQNLLVFDVTVDGLALHVDVYGGADNVCGTISFRFKRRSERRRQQRTLRRWQRSGTPITFVARGSSISLMDERALFDDLRPEV
jgi:hypothetical protein